MSAETEVTPAQVETKLFSSASMADLEKQLDANDFALPSGEEDAAGNDAAATDASPSEKQWFEEDAPTPTTEEEEDPETKARLDALELNEPWRKGRLNRESQKRQAAEAAKTAAETRAAALEAELAQYRSGKPAQPPAGTQQAHVAPDDAQMEAWIVENVPAAQRAKMDLDAAMDLSKYATTGEAVVAINKAQRAYDRTVDQIKTGIHSEIQAEATQKQVAAQTMQQKAAGYFDAVGKSAIPGFPKVLAAFRQNVGHLHDAIVSAVVDYPEPDVATAAIMSSKANFEYFQAASRDPSKIPAALARLGALTEAYKANQARPAAKPAVAPGVPQKPAAKPSAAPDVPRGEGSGGGDTAYYEKLFKKDPVAYTKGVMSKKYPDINGILD